MKVLQFVPSLSLADGGTTTYMLQSVPVLGQMCELHVCALGALEDMVPLSNCTMHSLRNDMAHFWKMRREWIGLLDMIQPDVVHVNCCWMPQISMVIRWTDQWRRHATSRDSRRLPLILTPHGMLEPWIMRRNYWTRKFPAIHLYQRRAVRRCDSLVTTSREEKEHLSALGWNSDISFVQNGIDVDQVLMKESWKKPEQLLFMSRIHPKKGLELLLQAIKRLISESVDNYNPRLVIAGEGDDSYVQRLRSLVENLGLKDRVSFVGAVYGDQKWNLIRQSDAVVLPSYSENYGLIVAESLASGTPVITTTGTPWEVLQQEQCGWWVDPDVDSVHHALTELYSLDANGMQKKGEAARRIAKRDCDVAIKMKELYQLYLSKISQTIA